MAQWDPHDPFHSWKAAEQEAVYRGEAPLGYLYRFEDKTYASLNPYKYEWGNDDEYDLVTRVELHAIPIRSVTPCGWTIKASNGLGWRFISKDTTKQFALPTVLEALTSYLARKERQQAIYEARADKAKYCAQLALGTRYKAFHAPRQVKLF
jgi:hypothetical protein